MADVTEKQFSELISAQRETTRQLMSVEERAAADAEASRKNANRVAGGIQAADTRKANADAKSLASNESQGEESSNLLSKIGKSFTSFFSFSKGSASSDKEKENEKASDLKKGQDLLGKIAGGITGLGKSFAEGVKDKAKKGLTGFMSMLKKFAIGGLMTALLLFMNSKYWQDTKKFISDKLMPGLEDFYENTLKPFVLGIGKFFKDPSWENFKNIFDVKNPLGLVAGLAGLTALLAPKLLFKTLKLGILGFASAISAAGTGISAAGTGLMKSGSDVYVDKSGKTRDKKTGQFAKKDTGKLKAMKNLGKGLLRGAKFLPVVGLGVTALMGVFDGVSAGLEEAKNKNSTKATVLRESIAGIGSGLTFGLIDQETISKGITSMSTSVLSGFNATKKAFTKGFDSVKAGINKVITDPEGAFNAVSCKLSELTGLKLPNFDETKAAITKFGNDMKTKFTDITGIEIPSFDETKAAITKFGNDMKTKFTDITGVEIPSFSEVKKGLTNGVKGISDFFKDIFDFDIEAVLKSVPGGETLLKLLGGEDSTAKRELADLKLIDYDTFNKDDLNFDKIEKLLADQRKGGGTVNPTILAALNKITEDDSIDEDDREKLKKMLARGKATGGPISSGKGYLVGELGPELIIPNQSAQVVNADRTKTMAEAALQRGAANQNSGSGTTVADMSQKVVNANKTSFTSVGQPLENTNMAGLVAAQ